MSLRWPPISSNPRSQKFLQIYLWFLCLFNQFSLELSITGVSYKPDIRSARILLAEDQPSSKKILLKTLFGLFKQISTDLAEWERTHVTWVQHGADALTAFENNTYDLILLDNQLLDAVSGFDVAIHLRHGGYTGPIVFITSADPKSHIDKLALQHVQEHAGIYILTPIEATAETERYPAYFSSKPCSASVLKCILSQDFAFPLSIKRSDSDCFDTKNSTWESLNSALTLSKNTETGLLDEEIGLTQLRLFHDFLTTRFPDHRLVCPLLDIGYGHIPQEDAKRHLVTSTFMLLLRTIPKQDEPLSKSWVNKTLFIIDKLFEDIESISHPTSQKFGT